jgi:hypothetical protein
MAACNAVLLGCGVGGEPVGAAARNATPLVTVGGTYEVDSPDGAVADAGSPQWGSGDAGAPDVGSADAARVAEGGCSSANWNILYATVEQPVIPSPLACTFDGGTSQCDLRTTMDQNVVEALKSGANDIEPIAGGSPTDLFGISVFAAENATNWTITNDDGSINTSSAAPFTLAMRGAPRSDSPFPSATIISWGTDPHCSAPAAPVVPPSLYALPAVYNEPPRSLRMPFEAPSCASAESADQYMDVVADYFYLSSGWTPPSWATLPTTAFNLDAAGEPIGPRTLYLLSTAYAITATQAMCGAVGWPAFQGDLVAANLSVDPPVVTKLMDGHVARETDPVQTAFYGFMAQGTGQLELPSYIAGGTYDQMFLTRGLALGGQPPNTAGTTLCHRGAFEYGALSKAWVPYWNRFAPGQMVTLMGPSSVAVAEGVEQVSGGPCDAEFNVGIFNVPNTSAPTPSGSVELCWQNAFTAADASGSVYRAAIPTSCEGCSLALDFNTVNVVRLRADVAVSITGTSDSLLVEDCAFDPGGGCHCIDSK